MPIYEYLCQTCGHHLEALQKFSDAPLRRCPNCGRDALSKKISSAGFQLKGSGWYVTDFKNPPKKESKETLAKTETKDIPKSSTQTDGSSKGGAA